MRRMSMDEVRAFLATGTRTAKIATVSADGHPRVVPVWLVLDGVEGSPTTSPHPAREVRGNQDVWKDSLRSPGAA